LGESCTPASSFSPLPTAAGYLSGGLFSRGRASRTMGSRRTLKWQDMNKGNIHLQDLIKYFDTYNRSEGKSVATLTWYNQTLAMLLSWLTETGRPERSSSATGTEWSPSTSSRKSTGSTCGRPTWWNRPLRP